MRPSLEIVAYLAAFARHTGASPTHGRPNRLLVRNDAFAVQGVTWPNNSAVNFFGNIPYAEPPVGELRFRVPVTKAPQPDVVINGSWFGPSCIQYGSGAPTVYSEYLTGFLLSPGQTQDEGKRLKRVAIFWMRLMGTYRLLDAQCLGPQGHQRRRQEGCYDLDPRRRPHERVSDT